MNNWQRILCLAAAGALVGTTATGALAATVSGRSSTVLEWLDDPEGDGALPFYQYLQLNVKDIDNDGLTFRGYGRFGDDLKDELDAKSRLYYAYVEKKDLAKDLDLRFGRQFIAVAAGASVMDGLYLSYEGLPVGVSLFGGGDVQYYEGYNAKDVIAGVEATIRPMEGADVSVSYLQQWDGGNLAREMFGLEGGYSHGTKLDLYTELQYDWLSAGVSYFLGGVNYHPTTALGLRAEYLYSLPVFEATSIYSVFAVSEYEEIMLEAGYRLKPGLRTFARYSLEMYPDFDDDNVIEAGIEKIRTERFSGYLSGILRDSGDGQDLKGVKARAAYLFHEKVQAGIGAEMDVLERSLDAFGGGKDNFDDTTSSRLWADATVYVTDSLNVQLLTERAESELYDSYYRGRLRVNFTF